MSVYLFSSTLLVLFNPCYPQIAHLNSCRLSWLNVANYSATGGFLGLYFPARAFVSALFHSLYVPNDLRIPQPSYSQWTDLLVHAEATNPHFSHFPLSSSHCQWFHLCRALGISSLNDWPIYSGHLETPLHMQMSTQTASLVLLHRLFEWPYLVYLLRCTHSKTIHHSLSLSVVLCSWQLREAQTIFQYLDIGISIRYLF